MGQNCTGNFSDFNFCTCRTKEKDDIPKQDEGSADKAADTVDRKFNLDTGLNFDEKLPQDDKDIEDNGQESDIFKGIDDNETMDQGESVAGVAIAADDMDNLPPQQFIQKDEQDQIPMNGQSDLPVKVVLPNVQGNEAENQILADVQQLPDKIRWLDKNDYQKGFLQLMSLQPLKNYQATLLSEQMDEDQKQQRTFKPFLNKEELMAAYDELFPAKKEQIKMIVVEVNDRIVFCLQLFMGVTQLSSGQNQQDRKTATIHDLLINRNAYGQLKDPTDMLKRLISGAENIAWENKCVEIQIPDGVFDIAVMENYKKVEQQKNGGEDYWSKENTSQQTFE